MIRNIINAIITATKSLFAVWKTTATFVVLYALLVLAAYLFFTTPEARAWQVVLTFLLIIVLPILFFMLQAMGITYADASAGNLFATALREFWKLLAITIPIILVTWLLFWGLTKIDSTLTTGWREAANAAATEAKIKAAEDRIATLSTVVTYATSLLLFFLVPLVTIRLWINTVREGIAATLKNILRLIFKSFAPRNVITYLLGFVIFGLLPYYLLTMRTPIKSPWLDLSVLGIRIVIALLIGLFGWIITVGALNLLTTERTKGTAPLALLTNE